MIPASSSASIWAEAVVLRIGDRLPCAAPGVSWLQPAQRAAMAQDHRDRLVAEQPQQPQQPEHPSPEPRQEHQKDARQARERIASEPDSGRQQVDRSRPSSYVRKTH